MERERRDLIAHAFVGWQILTCFWIGGSLRFSWLIILSFMISVIWPTGQRLSAKQHVAIVAFAAVFFSCIAVWELLALFVQIAVLFQTFAEFLFLVQILELFRVKRESSENYLPGLGTLAMVVFILSVDVTNRVSDLTWPSMVFFALMLLQIRSDIWQVKKANEPNSKRLVLLILAAIAVITGNLFQQELQRDVPQLRQGMGILQNENEGQRIIVGANARFVEYVTLDTIVRAQLRDPEATVYNVESDFPPGYMRTRSFSFFNGTRWRDLRGGLTLFQSVTALPAGRSSELRDRYSFPGEASPFELSSTADEFRQLKVEVPRGRGGQIPLALDTAIVIGKTRGNRAVGLDPHCNLLPGSLDNTRYQILTSPSVPLATTGLARRDSKYLTENLQLPEGSTKGLTELAKEILEDDSANSDVKVNVFPGTWGSQARTPASEKALRIAKYFHSSFDYSLDAKPATDLAGRSPIEAFLREKREAHCEYFATATVLLLRATGIPSRLSTGYLVYEMNDENDYFQATNANAHAWAEFYDDQIGSWIAVESTPSIPDYVDQFLDQEGISGTDSRIGTIDSNWRRVIAAVFAFFENSRIAVVRTLSNRFAWLLPLILCIGFFAFRIVRRSLSNLELSDHRSHVVIQADSLAARLGFERAQGETCHQFAARMRDSHADSALGLADWYERYAEARYLPSGNHEAVALPKLRDLKQAKVA